MPIKAKQFVHCITLEDCLFKSHCFWQWTCVHVICLRRVLEIIIKFIDLTCKRLAIPGRRKNYLNISPFTWNTIECHVDPLKVLSYSHKCFINSSCFQQGERLRNELDLLRHNYHSANDEIQSLRVALEESRSNGDRLHRESELVVQNVNTWVQEQKWVVLWIQSFVLLVFEYRVFFKSVGNGARSLAIGKIAQFWYGLGKVQKSINFKLIN